MNLEDLEDQIKCYEESGIIHFDGYPVTEVKKLMFVAKIAKEQINKIYPSWAEIVEAIRQLENG